MQTLKPKHLIIYDDGEQKDLRHDPMYQNIFTLLSLKGIAWKVEFGARRGQVFNHQRSIEDAKTEWIWRIDDDTVMEPDVLEKLMNQVAPDVGAIGGLVIDPKIMLPTSKLASNKIEDIGLGMNIQWFRGSGVKEVDHLYSTFIYRKEAAKHGYCLELSRVGHREETIFTYEMRRAGWRLLVDTSATTWHFRCPTGGIRSDSGVEMWAHDEEVFARKMQQWGVTPKDIKLVVLDNGLGDHLVFKSVLPDLKKKYKNIVLANCYPEVFEDDTDIQTISIGEATLMTNIGMYNIYRFLWDNTDKHWSLEEAYRRLYGVDVADVVEKAELVGVADGK